MNGNRGSRRITYSLSPVMRGEVKGGGKTSHRELSALQIAAVNSSHLPIGAAQQFGGAVVDAAKAAEEFSARVAAVLTPPQAVAVKEPIDDAVAVFADGLAAQVRELVIDKIGSVMEHRRQLVAELEHERAARQEADELAKLYESELNELRGKLRALAG